MVALANRRFALAAAASLALAALALPGMPRHAGAAALEVVSSDAHGVTLRFTLPGHQVASVTRPEGTFWQLEAPGLKSTVAEEGRPLLPAESALLGMPAGTIPSLRVLEETWADLPELAGKDLEPLGKSEFRPDGKDLSPTRVFYKDPAFYDGGRAWPTATAELGVTGGWRHQRVVSLRVQPFRVDPAARTVRMVTSATIRVDFVPVGGARPQSATGLAPGSPLEGSSPAPPASDDRWEGLYRRALLNYDAARAFRTTSPELVRTGRGVATGSAGSAAGQGVAYDPADEWTVRVDTTGVWRVSYAQLAAQGFPAGVPVTQLALTRREYAGGQVPPFVRVPVPIQVIEGIGGAAGQFDAQDALVFYGQSWTGRAHPSDNRRRFGDYDMFYLGVDAASGGARMPVVSADRGLVSPSRPASFPSYRKYEKRYFFLSTPKDTCTGYMSWTFPYTDGTFTDSLTMWTPDVDPAGTVRFQSRLLGILLSPYQHTMWMRWKRPSDNLLTPVATRTWGGREALETDTTFTADRIASGTNKLDFRGYTINLNDPDGGASGGSIQSYSVTYSRLYRAFQNRLDCNSSDAQGDFEIEVDGFAAPAAPAPTVYDVSDSTAPRVLAIPPAFVRSSGTNLWAVRFQDQAAVGTRRNYVAVLGAPQVADAAVGRAGRVGSPPIWDVPGRPELVIVTPELFRPAAERLAAHRRTQGYDVLVASENEVYDTFDGGRRSDWAIRRLLEYAFARWNARFALLVGDASEDARNELATSDKDWLPAHLISGPVGTSNGQELSASEFWYVNDLDNTSPPGPPCTNSEPDPFPDMSIGRFAVGSLAEADGLVDKVIAYDASDKTAAWRHKVVLLPDDAYSFASFFGEASTQYCYRSEEQVFEAISNQLETVLRSEGGYRDLDIEQFRLREKLASLGRPVPGCQPLDNLANVRGYVAAYTGPQLLTDLADGCLVLNFQGHGSATVLAHESIWRQDRGAGSTDLVYNEGKPYFFLSFSCHVNQFTTYIEKLGGDGLGEVMVLGPQNPARPAAGAIGSYASTNFELLPSDRSGRNHLNNWLFRAMFVDPPHDSFLGEKGARVLLGEALTLGGVNSSAATFGLERRAIQTYCLLGDPSTPIETGAPRLYATANGQAVVSGVRFQPGAPGDSVALVVDLVDESRIDDLALTITGEGARTVDPSEYTISPTYPDTLNDGGGRRYLLTWNVRPQAKDADLTVSCKDRSGLPASFTLQLRLETRLFANGQSISEGDIAPSTGAYQLVVNSPARLNAGDFDFTVDGIVPAGLIATPAPTDSSRRLWVLSWQGAYETGSHDAVLVLPGGGTRRVSFLTSNEPRVALRRVFAFPSPFAAPPVTINFTLDSDRPTTVAVKVYSVAGALVYQRVEPAVAPGYHQWIWDGNDNFGGALANGTYLYNVIAEDDRGLKAVERGKLARLR